MTGVTRREALSVGAGVALAAFGAAGLAGMASSSVVAGGSYRGVRFRVLSDDRLELDGVLVDEMAFGRVGDRYVSHLLCYEEGRDPVALVRGLIDGRAVRLFDL